MQRLEHRFGRALGFDQHQNRAAQLAAASAATSAFAGSVSPARLSSARRGASDSSASSSAGMTRHTAESSVTAGKSISESPGLRGVPRERADLFENCGRGISGFERDGNHFAAGRFHLFPAHDFARAPIGALDQHVGKQSGRSVRAECPLEDHHEIHSRQRRQQFRALAFADQRARVALSRRTLASLFSPTTSTSPSERACSSERMCPG